MAIHVKASQAGIHSARLLALALAGGLLTASGAPAMAKDITVQMKTQGKSGSMVFEPAFVKAQVGDRIHFTPTDPGHNAETIGSMLPVGAAAVNGKMNAETVLTLTKPGLYGIKCKPHYVLGMVALIQAGAAPPANLAAVKAALPTGLAGRRFAELLSQVK